MEFDIDTISLALLAFSVLFLLYTFLPKSPTKTPSYSTLPGPSLLSYLSPNGSLNRLCHDPRLASAVMNGLHTRHGEVFGMRLGFRKAIATSNVVDILQMVNRETHFGKPDAVVYTSDEVAPNSLFTLTGSVHSHKRTTLQRVFNPALLHGFHKKLGAAIAEGCAVMRTAARLCQGREDSEADEKMETAKKLLTECHDGKYVIDFARAMSIVTLSAITNVAFGAQLCLEERHLFLDDVEQLSNEMLVDVCLYPLRKHLYNLPIIGRHVARKAFSSARTRLEKRCETLMQGRLSGEGKGQRESLDLMDAIVDVENGAFEPIRGHVMTFALAGSLSTNQTIAWMLYELCAHPLVYRRVRREVDAITRALASKHDMLPFEAVREQLPYTTAVWKETLRMHPPAYLLARQAKRDVILEGSKTLVEKGMMIQALVHCVHQDDGHFEQAKRFIPERWLNEEEHDAFCKQVRGSVGGAYIPFGIGAHNCPGQFFAEHEGVFVVAQVIRDFDVALACKPCEVVSCSGFVEIGRFSSHADGRLDVGIPVLLTERK